MTSSFSAQNSSAFVFVAHILNRAIYREYEKIARAVQGLGTPWLVFQGEADQLPRRQQFGNLFVISRRDLKEMGYPMFAKKIYPGSNHFPFLNFYSSHPDYNDFWMIEYDVRFTGDWRDFFIGCAALRADFLSTHICRYQEESGWYHWNHLSHPNKSIPLESRLRCFHPVMRISNAAMGSLCADHRDGWYGHSEVLIPTLLQDKGFSLADFGGEGAFVSPGMQNKFYTSSLPNRKGSLESGTFRFRPSYARPGKERNKLYHPVKPLPMVFKEKTRTYLNLIVGKPRVERIIIFIKNMLDHSPSGDEA
jgi:hypothetical protein